jgi:REP element-mobilizing transposase RayT
MSLIYNSLSHSKWDCKYHIIFIPKMRKNRLYGDIRPRLGQIFHALATQKDVKIVEGYLKPDHIHMLVENTTKVQSLRSGRLPQRKECYCGGQRIWRQEAELHWRELLGPRLCCVYGWL